MSSMTDTNAFLFESDLAALGFVRSSDEQLVRTNRPADVSSLKLDPNFIFPKSSPKK